MSRCPLCDAAQIQPSWLGETHYAGRCFAYQECCACRSSFCDPMPEAGLLAAMYGEQYTSQFSQDADGVKDPGWVLATLETLPRGLFVDYGCGDGSLLVSAARQGWQSAGVEIEEGVARAVAKRIGCPVYTPAASSTIRGQGGADVLHLGDVIEHLTQPLEQLSAITALLKPGGLLLAQGPLEANACLFAWMLIRSRQIRRRPSKMPPYHVLLATVTGQKRLFERAGLTTLDFKVSEVAWPAPEKLAPGDIRQPRRVGMFVLRRISQLTSRLNPASLGNRYRYAGRLSLRSGFQESAAPLSAVARAA